MSRLVGVIRVLKITVLPPFVGNAKGTTVNNRYRQIDMHISGRPKGIYCLRHGLVVDIRRVFAVAAQDPCVHTTRGPSGGVGLLLLGIKLCGGTTSPRATYPTGVMGRQNLPGWLLLFWPVRGFY